MKKRMLFIAMAAIMLFVPSVMAAEVKDITSLKECLNTGGTCKVTNNIDATTESKVTISNDKLDVWGSKTAYTGVQYGIPELKMKSGTLYFRVLDKEDREKVLNEYDLIEQKDDCLIFDTHSDAGKCTVPKVVQANQ